MRERQQVEWRKREELMQQMSLELMREMDSGLILFPPFPPSLGARPDSPGGSTYPTALAEFAGEPFFMAFCSLRVRQLLSLPRLRRFEAYEQDRDKLVLELREALARTRDQTGGAPLAALATLSATQEKSLRKLAAEAENLHRELTIANSSQPYDSGEALAKARDAIKPDEQPGMKAYCTALLAAQFHVGLSPDQRQLLLEIAADSVLPKGAAKSEPSSPQYFLPACARLRWPDSPDRETAAKLESFQAKRAALKQELADAVADIEAHTGEPKRTAKYKDLADQEAPRFAELENLAEEIRLRMNGLPLPDQPAPSRLPADLINRVGHMMDGKTALLREVQRAGKHLGKELAPERVEVVYLNNTASLAARPPTDPTAALKKDREYTLARLQSSNVDFKRLFGELAVVMSAVRTEIQRYHDTLSGDKVPDVNALSIQLARAYTVQENWNRYRDYRDAVLTPGLSPAQRRLLFSAAVADLERFRLSLAN